MKARTFDQVSVERMKAEPTPETDAQDVIYPRTNGSKFLEPWVLSEFARKLERERNNAENQLELMTCKAAGWQNQATTEAKALVECWEKAERYRLEANAMMAQRDEALRKVAELQAGLDDIEEYGTEEINAAVDLRHQLGAALVERDKAISVADELIEYAHECLAKLESWGQGYKRYEDEMDRIREDIAAYNMMKEALK